jgi:hypothetical protein
MRIAAMSTAMTAKFFLLFKLMEIEIYAMGYLITPHRGPIYGVVGMW